MKKSKGSKTAFYGESTEKDVPVFLLAQALGVWGKPHVAPAQSKTSDRPVQGDLFINQ